MKEKYNNLLKKIDEKKEYLKKLLCDFIKIDTTNPPGDEYKLASFVINIFKQNNIRYDVFEKEKGRTNVVGYIGETGPKIMIASHMDVVPAGDGWHTSPFEPYEKENKIYGRGAGDNKGPLAASMVIAEILKEIEQELKCQVIIAAVADEEQGSTFGMEYLLKEKLINPDFAIIPDIGGNLTEIDIAEKGVLHIDVISHGKQVHGSKPDLGINAIVLMSELITCLQQHNFKYTPHDTLNNPTINFGIISGGSAINTVPSICKLGIDIRYLPSQTPEDILNEIKTIADKVIEKHSNIKGEKGKFEFNLRSDLKPSDVDPENILVKITREIAPLITGKEVKLIGMGGATVAKQLNLNGITAIGFSPGNGEVFHSPNEYIDINELIDFVKIMCLIILNDSMRIELNLDSR